MPQHNQDIRGNAVTDFCLPACPHLEECGVCVGKEDTDCLSWKVTELKCPGCAVLAAPQSKHDLGHVEYLKVKDDAYKCPVCGTEYDGLPEIMGALLDEIMNSNQYYERTRHLHKNSHVNGRLPQGATL